MNRNIFIIFYLLYFSNILNNILFDKTIYSSNNELNDNNNFTQNDYKKKQKIYLYINLYR